MSFNGYPKGIQGFLQELKANNNKEWFTANRARFDELVIEPSIELISALSERLSKLDPMLIGEPKVNKSIRRIFRDTRFSKDKTPYHTRLHMVFWSGAHPNRSPGVHIVLADDHFGYGAGHWGFEADQLENFRSDIMKNAGKSVAKATAAATKAGLVLDDPALKQVPKGFDRDQNWSQWARYKGLVVKSGNLEYPEELFDARAVKYITGLCEEVAPLNKYLVENIFA